MVAGPATLEATAAWFEAADCALRDAAEASAAGSAFAEEASGGAGVGAMVLIGSRVTASVGRDALGGSWTEVV